MYYNWRPDLPDKRDFLYSAHPLTEKPIMLSRSVDLRPQCSSVVNQGQIGSCTGNALAGAIEFIELQQLGDDIDDSLQNEIFLDGKFASVSRLFIYYNERWLEGRTQEDSGATLRDGVKSLTQWGVCKESDWKYSESNLFKQPTEQIYEAAKPHSISVYLRIQTLLDMRQCLASGFPFVFGFSVYESFESPEVARTGVMPMPYRDESLLGGHAVMAVGYDDAREVLLVRNSWGREWGQKGYFEMPYAYVEDRSLSQDFWTIRK